MTTSTVVVDGAGTVEWSVWTTTARLVVTDPTQLPAARELVEDYLARVDRAASRFRPDSEVSRLAACTELTNTVSPLLAELVEAALAAAAATDGAVDPTLGAELANLGYDRDLAQRRALPPTATAPPAVTVRRRSSWTDVRVDGTDSGTPTITMPVGILLDLGATAKAFAADHCATEIASRLGCGVLVSLGGDLRVAGPAPADGWVILVQDGADQPASSIKLTGAQAVATSSTLHRTWKQGATMLHHVLDPASCRPADPVWRTATVAASTCLAANTLTTEALVRGLDAPSRLRRALVAARLVAADGTVVALGGWPQ